MPVELSPETLRRLRVVFKKPDWPAAKRMLEEECGNNLPFLEQDIAAQLERFRFAALKLSGGSLPKLRDAVELAKADWRDCLLAAGFAMDTQAHERWVPLPQGSAGRVDANAIGERLAARLTEALAPLDFRQRGMSWSRAATRRADRVRQIVRLLEPLADDPRSCVFLLDLEFSALPTIAVAKIPSGEPGYRFSGKADQELAFRAFDAGVESQLKPLLVRFTSRGEVKRGLKDGSLAPF